MRQYFIGQEIKKINIMFSLILVLILVVVSIYNINNYNLSIQKKLEQQAELCILNINKISTNSEFLITYLSNLISINDNHSNKNKMQKILNSVANTQSIKSVVVWIDNQNKLFHSQNNINTHYINDLSDIIPVKELILNAYQNQINPYIIEDIRFYHEKIFSVVTYLQKNKKPIGYLLVGFSLSNLLDKLNLVPNKYNINIALLDIKYDVHTVNSRETISYDQYGKKIYRTLRLLKAIDNSEFFFLVTYDKKTYWIKIIKLIFSNILIILLIYIIIMIYTKLLINKFITPIENISKHINSDHIISNNYSIYEIQHIKEQLMQNMNYYKISEELKDELEIYKTQLSYTRKIKSEFTSRVSHEIKTPLNVIILYSEIIKNEMFGKIDNSKYKNYASYIYNSGQALLTMIEDLLLLNKIENNKMDPNHSTEIDIQKIITEILHDLNEYIKNKKVNIAINIIENLPTLILDHDRTKRALHHVIHNAIKFNKQNDQTIHIKGAIKKVNFQDLIELKISNQCAEIDETKIKNITLPFYQVDSGIDRKFDGLGIGLTIAKKFIEMQGGKFDISSANEAIAVTISFVVN